MLKIILPREEAFTERMKETHEFLVPDYYLKFSCKMGACRSSCCVGWPISVSMQNYFFLLGLDCPKHLRDRLDCGLRVIDHPTEEEYARFEPRYDGNCPMRMPDGLCALHAELGEGDLPDVCRLYPRGIRAEDGIYECSCANSCEAVLEMLLQKKEPLSFSFEKMTVQMPPMRERKSFFETLGVEQRICLHLGLIMQDRSMTLPQRMICLGDVLDQMDTAFQSKDKVMLERILSEKPTVDPCVFSEKEIGAEHLRSGLKIVEEMIAIFDARSQSIRDCGEAALAYFGDGEDALARYSEARSHFNEILPDWEIFYEHMLVNHMFFSQFPFQDRPESMHSEYVALCAVYAIMRFLGLGCMAERRETEALIDGMAATFRLIDHTEFDRYAAHLLKRLNCTESEQLYDLLCL